jgi:hypothetical protein
MSATTASFFSRALVELKTSGHSSAAAYKQTDNAMNELIGLFKETHSPHVHTLVQEPSPAEQKKTPTHLPS